MPYKAISQHHENYGTPVDSPMYGPVPTVYKDAVFNYVYFTTSPENVAGLLPEPFEPGKDGLCVGFSIDIPFSSSYGPFHEMAVVVEAFFHGERVFYLPAMFLDNDSAIAAGREMYGSPKKLAQVRLEQEHDIFVATCVRNGIEIIQISTRTLKPAKEADFIPIFPVYNLKMIPSVDKPEPVVKQITSTGVDCVTTHWMFNCAGTIRFNPTVATDIWKLQPEAIVGAARVKMDYQQEYGSIIFDYLAE